LGKYEHKQKRAAAEFSLPLSPFLTLRFITLCCVFFFSSALSLSSPSTVVFGLFRLTRSPSKTERRRWRKKQEVNNFCVYFLINRGNLAFHARLNVRHPNGTTGWLYLPSVSFLPFYESDNGGKNSLHARSVGAPVMKGFSYGFVAQHNAQRNVRRLKRL
jgi:hypothetical protein